MRKVRYTETDGEKGGRERRESGLRDMRERQWNRKKMRGQERQKR